MRYVTHSADHVGDPPVESKVPSAVTGREIDEEGLYRLGERIFNLQRAILTREGHRGRASDVLPETDFTLPLKFDHGNPETALPGKGNEVVFRKGQVLDREKFEGMKDEYYQLRGWDVKTGLQKKDRLATLGLDDVARELNTKGLVV